MMFCRSSSSSRSTLLHTTMAARASQAVAADSVPFARAKSTGMKISSALPCPPVTKPLSKHRLKRLNKRIRSISRLKTTPGETQPQNKQLLGRPPSQSRKRLLLDTTPPLTHLPSLHTSPPRLASMVALIRAPQPATAPLLTLAHSLFSPRGPRASRAPPPLRCEKGSPSS